MRHAWEREMRTEEESFHLECLHTGENGLLWRGVISCAERWIRELKFNGVNDVSNEDGVHIACQRHLENGVPRGMTTTL